MISERSVIPRRAGESVLGTFHVYGAAMIADLVATLSRSTILLPGTSILNSLILASTFSVMSCRDAGKEALPPPASVPTDSSIARAGTSTTPVDSSATASTANIQDECTRGTPIKVFAPSVPGVVWSKFELTSNPSADGIDIPYGNADMPSRLVIEDSTLSRLGIQSDSTRAPAKVRFMLQIGPL